MKCLHNIYTIYHLQHACDNSGIYILYITSQQSSTGCCLTKKTRCVINGHTKKLNDAERKHIINCKVNLVSMFFPLETLMVYALDPPWRKNTHFSF